MTINIYSDHISERLRYVLDYIFIERLGINYNLYTANVQPNIPFDIVYSNNHSIQGKLYIKAENILFETGIKPRNVALNRWKHSFVIFYNNPSNIIPFDILGAVFYFISRYEEYLPHKKDAHNRFSIQQSIAFQYSFHQTPVIDEWLIHLKKILISKVDKTLAFKEESFEHYPTMDIDLLYKYKHKSLPLHIWGLCKDLISFKWLSIIDRFKVISNISKDPFQIFDQKLPFHYFVLTLKNKSTYDRNSLALSKPFEKSIISFTNYPIGIHPSYYADNSKAIADEKGILENTSKRSIISARMHYIKLNIPNTYHQLINNNILQDYSMGWADGLGFRAGTSRPFYWYNIEAEKRTSLEVFPFSYMDAAAIYYKKLRYNDADKELKKLIYNIQKVNGLFIPIWHNYIIGDKRLYKDYNSLYIKYNNLLNHYLSPLLKK